MSGAYPETSSKVPGRGMGAIPLSNDFQWPGRGDRPSGASPLAGLPSFMAADPEGEEPRDSRTRGDTHPPGDGAQASYPAHSFDLSRTSLWQLTQLIVSCV